jgi:tetratricopeptide (TPR) repeat protein
MKLLFTAMLIALMTLQVNAQILTTPRAVSPAAEFKQTVGISTVTINYSRPRVSFRGTDRTGKIWGQQIPWGFEATSFVDGRNIPWRAGANENTIITFSDDVKIEGKDLAAGAYGLHMAIYEDGKATVIFSKNTSSWGSYYYDKAEDALRVDVISEETAATELLTYDAVGMDNNSAILAIKWEKKMIPFKVEFDVTNVVLSKMRDDLRSTAGFGWQGLNQAANFCVRNQINQEEALTWVDRSIANNKNFNNMATKSALLKQMGKTEEATKMEAELVAVASMGELNNLGYQKLGQKDYDAAIKYFSLNTKRNPKNANCWDSLGEAYKTKGDKNNAIKSFKKSLSLDPPANVKSNSILLLKELGVDTKSYES